MFSRLREWYIAVIGLFLIAGGLYFAAQQINGGANNPEAGNYTIVDHALTRLERGLVGILSVDGPPNLEIYNGQVMPGMGH